ncbi:hypothetical protein J2Y02_004424 [Neobacillus drentensis]|nr:hypothetical protein [Neobacillus drentensis]
MNVNLGQGLMLCPFYAIINHIKNMDSLIEHRNSLIELLNSPIECPNPLIGFLNSLIELLKGKKILYSRLNNVIS